MLSHKKQEVYKDMKEMTKGSPFRIIVSFTIPLIFGNLLQQLYNIVDSKIVSAYVSSDAFAAVSLTAVISNMLIGFINGCTQGFAIPVALHFGAQSPVQMRKNIAGSLKLVLLDVVMLMSFGLLFIEPILHLINTPDNIFADALSYVRIILLGIPFISLYNECANVLRAVGDSRTPLYFLLVSVILNTCFDLLFVKVLHFGIQGAAAATILSQFLCAFACLVYIRLKYKEIIPQKEEWKPDRRTYSRLISSGLSMGLMGCIVNIGTIILHSGLNSLGTPTITAHSAARRFIDMLMILIYTYGFTMTTYSSQNLGAGEHKRIRDGVRTSVLIVTVISTLLIFVCYLVARPIVQWIASTEDPAIVQMSVNYCRFNVLFFYALGPLFIFRCSLQGLGHRVIPLTASVLELCIKICAVLFLVPRYDYWGVIVAEPLSWVVMTTLLLLGYVHTIRQLGPNHPIIGENVTP